MNRLVNFLQEDLKEISHSFQNITETINCTINVEDESMLAKDIERLETFIMYWSQHAKNITKEEV
jgi:hypothetical protein